MLNGNKNQPIFARHRVAKLEWIVIIIISLRRRNIELSHLASIARETYPAKKVSCAYFPGKFLEDGLS
jgi:hypothetical protein